MQPELILRPCFSARAPAFAAHDPPPQPRDCHSCPSPFLVNVYATDRCTCWDTYARRRLILLGPACCPDTFAAALALWVSAGQGRQDTARHVIRCDCPPGRPDTARHVIGHHAPQDRCDTARQVTCSPGHRMPTRKTRIFGCAEDFASTGTTCGG
jgi:hypothetical protein